MTLAELIAQPNASGCTFGCTFNVVLMSADAQAGIRKAEQDTMMLNVAIERAGNAAVLHCTGRIVAGREATAFRDAVICHLAKHSVVLDFSEVTAIDASGLGMLVFLHTCAYGIGSELKLVGLSANVRSVFEVTNLLSVFEASSDAIDTAFGEPCETC